MKISKLLNSLFFLFLTTIFTTKIFATEPVDIWKSNSEVKTETIESETIDPDDETTSLYEKTSLIENDIFQENTGDLDFTKVYGLYDPEENNLSLELWIESDGKILLEHLKRIEKMELSKDSEELLTTILFTNSYLPIKNINSNDFLNYKLEWLIRKDDLNMVEIFLDKNSDLENNEHLLKYLMEKHLSNADVDSACEKIKFFNQTTSDIYLLKFRIYCFIHEEKIEEAQLQYDLLKEREDIDNFFNEKINYLLGYTEEIKEEVSENNLLNFYLSHKVSNNFKYEPTINTSAYIWKYLSSAGLLMDSDLIDLEDEVKFNLYEKAASNDSFNRETLFNMYGNFLFTFDQFLNAEEVYTALPSYKARALIYQSALLSDSLEKKLNFLVLLNDLFKKDEIENAFSEELSIILSQMDESELPEEYLDFYQTQKKAEDFEELRRIKFDNKIIHKSKLLKYFIEDDYKTTKIEEDLISLYKKIKKDKKYYFSAKDIILLDSLKADGIELPKKLENKYSNNQLTIPKGLLDLSDEGQTGLVLLKIVEIIGEDQLEDLDPDTLYFITATLNKLDLKKIRNTIILKTLPYRV